MAPPAATRPRLLSVAHDAADVDEQIRQVAHIVRLPDDWAALHHGAAQPATPRHVVCARAEWVLRWLLDKLQQDTQPAVEARAAPAAWQLLACMLRILPASRSAPHLRDAPFTTLLERTLQENWATADVLAPAQPVASDAAPSRKRKRPSPLPSPSSTPGPRSARPALLFGAIHAVLRCIAATANADASDFDFARSRPELMKMVLRAKSTQAARILRLWVTAVHKLLVAAATHAFDSAALSSLVDLSVVLDLWHLRTLDAADSTASSSQEFAHECLVPMLQLAHCLKHLHAHATASQYSKALDVASQNLDRLLTSHLLAPARSAFFSRAHDTSKPASIQTGARALTASLGPLRTILSKTTQTDQPEAVLSPQLDLDFLSTSIGYLLDLVIRTSPSRLPKARLAERPWIQAAFLSLAECAGCPLDTPPEYAASGSAVASLQSALQVLHLQNVTIDSAVLRKVFWYHCGVKYPEKGHRRVHWALIASVVELDASIFATEPSFVSGGVKEEVVDLTQVLFDQISSTHFEDVGPHVPEASLSDPVSDRAESTQSGAVTLVLNRIIKPILYAYSRNRNMLGFMRRWDIQLARNCRPEGRNPAVKYADSIWEDRAVAIALTDVFEPSLTASQISTLLGEHATRLDDLKDALAVQSSTNVAVQKLAAFRKASSSAIIVPAVLLSVQSHDTLTTLTPHLRSLLATYTSWVTDDQFYACSRLSLTWYTLSLLLDKLWPIEVHQSPRLQHQWLHPLLEQSTKDVSISASNSAKRRADAQTRAAAIMFALLACDLLQVDADSQTMIRHSLHEIVVTLSTGPLSDSGLAKTAELFCANFVQLLGHMDAETSRKSIQAVFSTLSDLGHDTRHPISVSLSHAVFAQGNSALHDAFSLAISDALGQNDQDHLHRVALQSLIGIEPSVLSRERREVILDRLSNLLITGPVVRVDMLCVIANLMVIPNASARISTEGAVIFEIALQAQRKGATSRSILQQLQSLAQRTLRHIVPNQNQAQSRSFLAEYQKQLNTLLTQGSKKLPPTVLAVLRATMLEQKDAQLLSVKKYIALLKQCLNDDGSDNDSIASFEDVLDAFDELRPVLVGDPATLKATTAWIRSWIDDNADLQSYITASLPGSIEVAEYVARLHKLVAKYRLFEDVQWLIELTVKIMRGPLATEQKSNVLATITEVLMSLETTEKTNLVAVLTNVEEPSAQAASYTVLQVVLSTLPDRQSTDVVIKREQLAVLPKICGLLNSASDPWCFDALMDGINILLNHKVSLVSQHSVECALGSLVRFTSRSSPALPSDRASHIFSRLCETARLVLLVHRSKTGGRSHLLVPLLQGLLLCLFVPASPRSGNLPFWLRSNTSEPVCLEPIDAAHYVRLIGALCNPPQSSIAKAHQQTRKSKELNDPVKAARERTSHFLYPLLASYCRFQLSGRLLPAVRAKLLPGLWEVITTASLHKEELDTMFAGLSRSEKDVWRSVWAEWERLHGRKEIFTNGDNI
ncbi:hypothetical protein ACEQ8H_007988 [Pleosporales sp. CAS-2024a]